MTSFGDDQVVHVCAKRKNQPRHIAIKSLLVICRAQLLRNPNRVFFWSVSPHISNVHVKFHLCFLIGALMSLLVDS